MSSSENRMKFLATWDVFRTLDHLIAYRSVEMFLMIAENNGEKLSTIREFFSYRQSVFTRHIGKLTERGYMKDGKLIPGLGLVMTVEDYDDHRGKRVYLTRRVSRCSRSSIKLQKEASQMCDAASATMAAVAVMSSAVTYHGQQEQASDQAAYQRRMAEERNRQMLENADTAIDAANEEYYQQGLRQQQEAEAASDEMQRVQRDKVEKMGTAIASSDGQLGALYADFQRQEARYKESVRRNFDMTTLQIVQQKRSTEAKAQDRINGISPYIAEPVSGPSMLGVGMDVAKAGINSYAHHKAVTEKDSPWQGVRF